MSRSTRAVNCRGKVSSCQDNPFTVGLRCASGLSDGLTSPARKLR